MFTKIDLCSMALLKLGEKPIQSWREDSAAAQLARTLFDPTLDTLLSLFPWRFATKELVLNKKDTKNILDAVNIVRDLTSMLNNNKLNQLYSNFTSVSNYLNSLFIQPTGLNGINQDIHIDASFPGVTAKQEIEEAFNDLAIQAMQHIHKY